MTTKDSVEGIKSQNRFVWDCMKETDPRFTKRVNKGFGEITTIDPQWQIMRMTEMFGPVGRDWNYTVNYTYTNDLVFAEVSVATSKTENDNLFWNYFGPVCSVQKLFRKTGDLYCLADLLLISNTRILFFKFLNIFTVVKLTHKYIRT